MYSCASRVSLVDLLSSDRVIALELVKNCQLYKFHKKKSKLNNNNSNIIHAIETK